MISNRLVATAICSAFIAGCGTSSGNETAADDAGQNQAATGPIAPVRPTALGRGDLLETIGRAASAYSLGQDDIATQRGLDGKIFEFRMRFGCPQDSSGRPGERKAVQFDEEKRTLRLSASPSLTIEDPTVAALTHGQVEAVEGFWIERPWLLTSGCPRRDLPAPANPVDSANQSSNAPLNIPAMPLVFAPAARFGIAQFFGEEDSRTLRRDSKPYEVTKSLPKGVSPSPVGYDIVLAGRLRKMADGKVIACTAQNPAGAPSCIVSAAIDRVAIRRGDNDELLAEWGGG